MNLFAPAPRSFGTIMVEVATIGLDGVLPGSAVKYYHGTFAQNVALIEYLDNHLGAYKALCQAIEEGEIATDPLRIEVPNFGRPWLIERGWTESRAKDAAAVLKRRNMFTKVYGQSGAAGRSVTVLNGEFFGWEAGVIEVTHRDGTRKIIGSRRSEATDAGGPPADSKSGPTAPAAASSQVTAFGAEASIRPEAAFGAFGDLASERPSVMEDLSERRPGVRTTESLVSAIGGPDANCAAGGPPRKKEVQEESLLRAPGEDTAPLTRAAVLRLFNEDAVIEALRSDSDRASRLVGRVFERSPEAAASGCAFVGVAADGDPQAALADLVVTLLCVDAEQQDTVVGAIRAQFKATKTHISRALPDAEVIGSLVLALCAGQDKAPENWAGYTVWASNNADWSNSTSIKALVRALQAVVFGEASRTSSVDNRAGSATQVPTGGLGFLSTPRAATNSAAMSPSEEEQSQRGEGYWGWMVAEVLPGTEFEDPESLRVLRRNRRMQDGLIEKYRRTRQASRV